MSESVGPRAKNEELLVRGEKAWNALMEVSDNPRSTNESLILKIIQDNKDTEYGKAHNFSDIHSIEDFKRIVPFSVFDDYADLVFRELHGEKDLHSVYGVNQYNRSSGTMGNPKKIPMSKTSMEYFLDYTQACPYSVVKRLLGDAFMDGKILSICEASGISYVNGIRYCGVSGQMVQDWNYQLPEVCTAPGEASVPEPETNSRYLHARYGLSEKNVTCLDTKFMTFVLEMFKYISDNWQLICDDIEKGTIDASIRMSDEVRKKLESELKPMPERAQELRKIFEEGFDNTIAKKIWPDLQFIHGVSTGTFSAYLKHLRDDYTGNVPALMRGITASEGAFTIPFELDNPNSIPTANTIFFEFLPLDEDDPTKTLLIDEVQEGGEYEMIVTTFSGLYRYRTRDAIRITGHYRNLPTMEYLYRIDQCVNLTGEKTYEPALRKTVDVAAQELGFKYTDFCVHPDSDSAPSKYVYYIEVIDPQPTLRCSAIAEIIQRELMVVNPLMVTKFERNLIGPVEVHVLQEDTYLLYRDKQILMGGASTQLKPVKIIMNEAQLRFFRILVEKEVAQ
ncbi:MAG: GH3 auxin-responsive promoter family protein [archaeon]|nr:GH3 auxin-responsive promoter family protein [archaeon]